MESMSYVLCEKFHGVSFYDFLLAVEKVYLNQWCGGVRKDERFGDYAKILRAIDKK
jgi:DNA-binding transcriptional regulator YdaS (Cro superfamily)